MLQVLLDKPLFIMKNTELHQLSLSLNHHLFAQKFIERENLLIIQDLDGVCMGLVKNPLDRVINYRYVEATQKLAGHFFVLTNGEHIGKFGVNSIIDKSATQAGISSPNYLPGLAAGGVQWQDNQGKISYPGVTQAELKFLSQIPKFFQDKLIKFCQQEADFLSSEEIDRVLDAVILNNVVSPTVNLNTFFAVLQSHSEILY